MMNFPDTPANGDKYTPSGGPTYVYSGGVWLQVAGAPAITDPYPFTLAAMQLKSKAAGQIAVNSKVDGTGTDVTTISSVGNFATSGTFTATGATSTGPLTVNGAANVTGGMDVTGNLRTMTGRILSIDGSANSQPSVAVWHSGRSTAYGFWNAPSNAMGFGTTDGGGVPSGTWASLTGTGWTTGSYWASSSTGVVVQATSGTNPYNQTLIQGNPNWNTCNLQTLHYSGVWAGMRLWASGPVWDFRNDGNAYKAGGGSWGDSSDERIKTVLGPLDGGLAAILQLNPVRYLFKGNDTWAAPGNVADGLEDEDPKRVPAVPYANSTHHHAATERIEYIGLTAQEVQAAGLGVLVTEMPGFIDGKEVSDLRILDQGPLVFVLINAVKELAAKVAALEAKG